MFTIDELEALVAGARMMETWAGPALGSHARSAIAKIALALPAARREEIERTKLFAPGFLVPKHAAAGLETVRQAILQRRKLRIEYVDGGNRASTRTLDPLALYFWGTTWSVAAWCESREDFRIFRLDRIRNLQMGGEKFDEVPGRTLADFVQSVSRVAGG
jgi:predicted DNA-binding transcriptional regulator YafY